MSNEAQAKLDRLKTLLGDDFPEPQPVPDMLPPNTTAQEQGPLPAPTIAPDGYDPSLKIVVEGSETDSDPDTVHRPSAKAPKKPRSRKRGNYSTTTNNVPHRTNPHLLSFNPNHPRLGELAAPHQAFCPIVAVSKYPYKFVGSDVSESIADKFFNDGKFWYRSWDIYYVWPQVSLSAKPFLLVPVQQVEQLLDEIFFAFDQQDQYFLTLGEEARDFGLLLEFPDHPKLRPRFVGNSQSRETIVAMERSVPTESFQPSSEAQSLTAPDTVSRQQYEKLMELIMELNRGRNKPQKKVSKKEEQARKKRAWKNELRFAERLLGLRPCPRRLEEPGADAGWDELQAYHEAKASHRKLDPIDPEKPAPYEFDKLPIFMSVDVECYELDKSKVTEIGFAMLDTADLGGHAPGKNGSGWHQFVKARHFRIREHAHLSNGVYVSDAANNFEFPKEGSEFISLSDAPQAIRSCFLPPYCHVDRHWLQTPAGAQDDDCEGSLNTSEADSGSSEFSLPKSGGIHDDLKNFPHWVDGALMRKMQEREAVIHHSGDKGILNGGGADATAQGTAGGSEPGSGRHIILVGHDIESDIRYLRHMGFDLNSLNTDSTLDTCNLYRACEHEWNPMSLSAILTKHDMVPWHSHNAGNDAVHTLWAMTAMVVVHTMERGDEDVKKRRQERQKQREMNQVVQAGLQAREMAEGWDSEDEI